jgi:hypothetical protein
MRRNLGLGLLAAALLLVGVAPVFAQQSMDIVGTGSVAGTGSASFGIEMTTTAPVEGYVVAISYDNSAVAITSVGIAGSVAASVGAELVVPEILATGFTLGVVLDASAPFLGQTIPAGPDQNIGSFTAQSIVILGQGDPPISTGFQFVNGVLNNPPLDNILVQGGLSIGQGQGLGLNGNANALEITPPPPAGLEAEDTQALSTGGGCARVLLDNDAGATQGFVLSISHNPAVLTLSGINLTGTATAAAGAEFVATNILATGGTIGVVLDFLAPFLGQTIPAGQDIHIANYCYNCNNDIIYVEGDPIPASDVSDLTFVDGVFGTPPLSNVVVVGGLSINPNLEHGLFECLPVAVPLEDTTFIAGGPGNPSNPVSGNAGDDVTVCLYYTDEDGDNLQGLQMAVCYDCALQVNDFSIAGSIFEAVGAEFVNWNIDSDPNDGDGCEFVLGILLDALPPFDGQTVPSTATPLLVGCLDITISPSAPCDECLTLNFCDAPPFNFGGTADGAGNVQIENIAIINFESIQGFSTLPCEVCVVPENIFQRGDCNSDDKVDLADAAKVLGWQFQGQSILCPDACDANDDGKINLADAVLLMNYLFKFGDAPPAPGPEDDGVDPTGDNLPVCNSDDSVC